MATDILSKVLTAATQRRLIYGGNPDTSFSLIVHADLTPKDAPKVRRIQDYVLENYGVEMTVVGGGSGCTRLTFDCESPEALMTVLRAIATDPTLKSLVQELGANFRISTPSSPFSYDGRDDSSLLAASADYRPRPKVESQIIHLSDLSSKSHKLPSRESMLELIVEFRNELKKVELPDFDEMEKVRDDVDSIHRAWQKNDATISGLTARIKRFERFNDYCGQFNYPTASGLVFQLCDILKTIQRAARHYVNV